MKDTIKLVDNAFGHSILGYCSDYQISELFRWDRVVNPNMDKNIVYTDIMVGQAKDGHDSSYAWLLEPIAFASQNYSNIRKLENKFQKIFTHERTLLDLSDKYEFVPGGSCWIYPDDQKIYEKSKNLSIIASNKTITDGHKFRHEVINNLKEKMDVYGRGWNPIDYKLIGLKDYRYSVVIENCKRDYWFTEKLLDTLACGTVPIYWGCPSIDKFFDPRGFIIFDNLNELTSKIGELTTEKYNEMRPYIEHNFIEAKKYMLQDEWVYKKIREYGK